MRKGAELEEADEDADPELPRLLTIILLILVTVTVIDHASEWLRRKLE